MEDVLQHFVNLVEDEGDEFTAMVEFAYNDYWQRYVRNTSFVLNTCYHHVIPMSEVSRYQVHIARHFPSTC